ncbi:MAG: hypothetical protein R3E79_36305 [Caldilineaceae bacterium]
MLVFSLLWSFAPVQPAQAQGDDSSNTIWLPLVASPTPVDTQVEREYARALALVTALEPYITVVDDQIRLAAVSAAKLQVDHATFQRLERVIALFNDQMLTVAVASATIPAATGVAGSAVPNPGGAGYFAVNQWGINLFWSEAGTAIVKELVSAGLAEVVAVIIVVVAARLGAAGIAGAQTIANTVGWIFTYLLNQLLTTLWPDMVWVNIAPTQYDELRDILPPYEFHVVQWKDGVTCNGQWRRYQIAWQWWPPGFYIHPISGCWDVVWPLPA